MKRFLILLTVVLLLVSACGRPKEEMPETPTAPTETTEPLPPPTIDQTDYSARLDDLFNVLPNEESSFEFTVFNGTATVTDYTGNGGAVRVPDTLGGAPVTAIGDGAFADRDDIQTLIFPDTVTEFGTEILQGTALTAFRTPFPTGEENGFLGYFWGAATDRDNALPILRSLKYLEIRRSAQTEEAFVLRHHALYDCTDLVAVRLPSMTQVGERAFFGCKNLRYLNADAIYEIGDYAFCGCSKLQTLSFGAVLSRVGFAALQDCNELMELTLPFIGGSRIENIYLGYLFGAETPAFSEKFYSPYLQKVTLSEGCSELPDFALFECRSLQTIILPETLTVIGARALSGCTAIQEITLPDACKTIKDAAFAGCTELESVIMENATLGDISLGVNVFLGTKFPILAIEPNPFK